jgi:hypothetical protein
MTCKEAQSMDQRPLGVYDTTQIADLLLKSSCTGTWGLRNTRQYKDQRKTHGRPKLDRRPSTLTVSAMICTRTCKVYLLPRNAGIGELNSSTSNTRIAATVMHVRSR